MEAVLEKKPKKKAISRPKGTHKALPGAGKTVGEGPGGGGATSVAAAPEAVQARAGEVQGRECPCECVEEMVATDGIWWRTYEEPDKPIEDYTTREIGIAGEFLAARYLAHHGYEILAQNWRTKFGEADIVCRNADGTVVLVEVKTRLVLSKDRGAMPELAVNAKKQKQYRRLGLVYLMQHPDEDSLRFDVMAINFIDRHSARLRHLVGAFDWDF